MISIRGMIDRFEAFRKECAGIYDIASKVAADNQDTLLSLNRDQMLLGRNTDGDLLSPDYLSDPHFKTPEAAKAYADMKSKLESQHNARIQNPSIYPNKPKNTPNLIVTGPFQGNMFINVSGRTYNISSTYIDTPDISHKYNDKVFGISPESKVFFFNNYIAPEFARRLSGIIQKYG
ncbi:hypothetical protein M2459_001347 [Parabacteroides sp. PF5-5]|uniref:hypothetical protein n=1 Tax=unclassified Parabacteroides TaxID=2649774 RepID=UPI002476D116|nr:MULTISPECIES: hypothetical protein [unclassified Parabacteroides]MDH6304612.1 hypothetical protein [Parabacteroides sp. PH5-39]MDH6315775.1 hypothetical protein [Parabacteroides sp. PF5-13]MDH6319434.1 hypothetical protein [Parabacteroides sp. PH5-13]MDH6323165.1 hypothetical protein [Parabacteroides sp. PH5-8]MDH6326967.1 hypothetical protein [Parabacteroides sp. PH5-41]